jgi:Transglutaminase-like superfamily/TgpA N-terminal domain
MNGMRTSDDFDPRIAAWLEADPHRAPAAVLEGVLAAFPAMKQRRRSLTPPWLHRQRLAVFGMLTAIVVFAVAATLAAIVKPWPSSVGGSGQPLNLPNRSQVQQDWSTNDDVAFTITRDPSDQTDYYWRAVAYDVIETSGWSIGPETQTDQAANARLFDEIADDGSGVGASEVTISVQPGSFTSPIVLSPGVPMQVDQPVGLVMTTGRYLSRIDLTHGTSRYTVTSLVGRRGNAPGEWSDSALRTAGRAYPSDMQRYTWVAEGSVGPNARVLEQRIVTAAGSSDPIDIVEAAMTLLRSTEFTYDTDIRDLPCESLSTVECFATYKQGFCQHYAATMAVLLRDLGIPTRIVEGFLPGTRSEGTEVVRNNNAHAWIEVYFPGYGWVPFDPTGANDPVQMPAALPS